MLAQLARCIFNTELFCYSLVQGCKNSVTPPDQKVYMCDQKSLCAQTKGLHAPDEEICQQYEDQSQ